MQPRTKEEVERLLENVERLLSRGTYLPHDQRRFLAGIQMAAMWFQGHAMDTVQYLADGGTPPCPNCNSVPEVR